MGGVLRSESWNSNFMMEFPGQRSLASYGSWRHKESDTMEDTHTHTQNLFTTAFWFSKSKAGY